MVLTKFKHRQWNLQGKKLWCCWCNAMCLHESHMLLRSEKQEISIEVRWGKHLES